MTTFEWFLLIVVVLGVPLVVAVMVTLWTLEQARQRNRKNRTGDDAGGPVKRNATRSVVEPVVTAATGDQTAPETPARVPVRESGSPG